MKLESGLDRTPWRMSEEKAEAELKRTHMWAWITTVLTFFILGFASFVAVGLGVRSTILSWRKVNASKPNGTKYKVSSIIATTIAIINTILYYYVAR